MTDTNKNNKQTKANQETEKLFEEYNSDSGKDSPEGKVNAALKKGQKAVDTMVNIILEIDGHANHVAIQNLETIDILKHSKIKNTDDIKKKLLKAKYTGSDTDIHIWQTSELRKLVPSNSKSGSSSSLKQLFNVASGITKNATVAILDYVEKSADKTKKEISENIAKVIPEHKYSDYITKKEGEEMNARLDRLTKKLATVVGKLSAPEESAKGYEHVGNRKLMSKAGKYSIYNTAMRKSGSAI